MKPHKQRGLGQRTLTTTQQSNPEDSLRIIQRKERNLNKVNSDRKEKASVFLDRSNKKQTSTEVGDKIFLREFDPGSG